MTTNQTIVRPSPSRSPNGCNKPVMTHVTEQERDALDAMATAKGCSLSKIARELMLPGLRHYCTEGSA